MSKILITGNGFDLFHGLPTKYGHFMTIMETIEKDSFIDNANFDELFGLHFKDRFGLDYNKILSNFAVERISLDTEDIKIIKEKLISNIWFRYFKTVLELDTWIDFELEIENVLEQLQILFDESKISKSHFFNSKNLSIYVRFGELGIIEHRNESVFIINENYINKRTNKIDEFKVLTDMVSSLEEFIDILNWYIKNIVNQFHRNINVKYNFDFEKIDTVFTFNYTSSIEEIYNYRKSKVVYLHGQNESNKIVLGVSDISTSLKSNRVFGFTKYYQRINKDSNRKFIKLPKSKENKLNETIFYIFGHSLDKSDKEYIIEIFKFLEIDSYKKSKICVFYINSKDKESKINNLLSIIDEKTILDLNKEDRLYFVEITEENVSKEFIKPIHKWETKLRIG